MYGKRWRGVHFPPSTHVRPPSTLPPPLQCAHLPRLTPRHRFPARPAVHPSRTAWFGSVPCAFAAAAATRSPFGTAARAALAAPSLPPRPVVSPLARFGSAQSPVLSPSVQPSVKPPPPVHLISFGAVRQVPWSPSRPQPPALRGLRPRSRPSRRKREVGGVPTLGSDISFKP